MGKAGRDGPVGPQGASVQGQKGEFTDRHRRYFFVTLNQEQMDLEAHLVFKDTRVNMVILVSASLMMSTIRESCFVFLIT